MPIFNWIECMRDNQPFYGIFQEFMSARQREKASHTIYGALLAKQEGFLESTGGGSASTPAPARAPRTRSTARKPAKSGDDDGDGEPAPRSRVRALFYDLDDVADALALSTRGVQRLVQEGSFPKPRAVSGRRVAWLVSEIEAWAVSRPVASMLPPVNAGQRKAA